MRWLRVGLRLFVLSCLSGAPPLAAQRTAQHAVRPAAELGVQAIGIAADPGFVGGGLYAAWRTTERSRAAVTLSAGQIGRSAAGRLELLGHFLLSPRTEGPTAVYGLGGAALVAHQGTRGYLVLGLGLETRPGARSGWVLEAGVGGGFRAVAGWRWRVGPAPRAN